MVCELTQRAQFVDLTDFRHGEGSYFTKVVPSENMNDGIVRCSSQIPLQKHGRSD